MKKSLFRFLVWFSIFTIMLIQNTAAFAGSYTETTTNHFNAGTHSSTQTLNLNGGEVGLDENTALYEVPVSTYSNLYDDFTVRPKIKADSNGILYATWAEDNGIGDGVDLWEDIWFSKSTNGGNTWSTPVKVDNADVGGCQEQDKVMSILPDIAIDESVSPPRIYIVWTDDRATAMTCPAPRFFNIYFSASTDGGSTWSPDVKVNNWPSQAGLNWGWGGSFLKEEIFESYYRDYTTGGPKVTVGAAPNYPILVTWMNDEIQTADYDVYYSKTMPTYPQYVFDADWGTPCTPPSWIF